MFCVPCVLCVPPMAYMMVPERSGRCVEVKSTATSRSLSAGVPVMRDTRSKSYRA